MVWIFGCGRYMSSGYKKRQGWSTYSIPGVVLLFLGCCLPWKHCLKQGVHLWSPLELEMEHISHRIAWTKVSGYNWLCRNWTEVSRQNWQSLEGSNVMWDLFLIHLIPMLLKLQIVKGWTAGCGSWGFLEARVQAHWWGLLNAHVQKCC